MDVFTAISLCTGYDGIGLGLRRAISNLRTIAYVERECFAVCNLVAKIQAGLLDDAPIWDDVSTFDGRPFAGLVDIIHAGVPCQPWSVAGKQAGTDDERWIWSAIFDIIVAVEPEYVFLEEVPGFVSGGGLGYVLSDLAQAGFDAQWGCFTAAEVGAPHKRERLFILAHRTSTRLAGREGEYGSGLPLPTPRSGEHDQLADSRCDGGSGRGIAGDLACPAGEIEADGEQREWLRDAAGDGGSVVADSAGERVQGPEPARSECAGGQTDEHGHIDRWPAPPGQPQHEWEEPRVVGDTTKPAKCGQQRCGVRAGQKTTIEGQADNDLPQRPDRPEQGQTEPGLG